MQLIVNNLKCTRNDRVLFANISFTINAGEVLHVAGANGAGKTSLLQMLCGLMQPQAGSIQWQGQLINANNKEEYKAKLAYVGHKIGVKDGLTVRENLIMVSKLAYAYSQIDWSLILKKLQLEQVEHTLCQKLSAGQRQRVALARLLILDASLWILDEPFTAMDKAGVACVQQLIAEHTAKSGMVILTTHQAIELPTVVIKQLQLVSH
jgi:heme exporter protein A